MAAPIRLCDFDCATELKENKTSTFLQINTPKRNDNNKIQTSDINSTNGCLQSNTVKTPKTCKVECSSVLQKVQKFLPKLAAANTQLVTSNQSVVVPKEDADDEDAEPFVEMNLGLIQYSSDDDSDIEERLFKNNIIEPDIAGLDQNIENPPKIEILFDCGQGFQHNTNDSVSKCVSLNDKNADSPQRPEHVTETNLTNVDLKPDNLQQQKK